MTEVKHEIPAEGLPKLSKLFCPLRRGSGWLAGWQNKLKYYIMVNEGYLHDAFHVTL